MESPKDGIRRLVKSIEAQRAVGSVDIEGVLLALKKLEVLADLFEQDAHRTDGKFRRLKRGPA
jgi:hypothetical protein